MEPTCYIINLIQLYGGRHHKWAPKSLKRHGYAFLLVGGQRTAISVPCHMEAWNLDSWQQFQKTPPALP